MTQAYNMPLTTEGMFNTKPLLPKHGPYIESYLNRIEGTINQAVINHPHSIAIRIDLRLSCWYDWRNEAGRPLFNRFIDSLKAKIKAYGKSLSRQGKRFHPTNVGFIWCREFTNPYYPHYHCILFFNKQTFRGLGELGVGSTGLYGMISRAWCSALNCSQAEGDGLVHVPQNYLYHLRQGERYDDLFKRASYLAKHDTKVWGLASHNFGASRQ